MRPLILQPNYIPSIWGGRRLSDIRGVAVPQGKAYGICREVCAYRGAQNTVAKGEHAGKNLGEVIRDYHDELMGEDPADQLVRVAYIDAVEDLSVQVHPGEEYAKKIGDFGKSEAWYILECQEGASIAAGTTITDRQELLLAAKSGDIERYIRRIPVKKGDFALVPSGMLHACGKNMLAIEIGSFGGVTYRVYDYGRPRPLDIEKSFEILDFTLESRVRYFAPGERPDTGARERQAICDPAFCVDVVDVADRWEAKKENRYLILTVVEGDCILKAEGEEFPLAYTETILLPACLRQFSVRGDCRILRSFRPLG